MANLYKQYLTLLKKWPVDPTKPGRDIAERLQKEVKTAFSRGAVSVTDEEKCARFLRSLTRLSNNFYGEKYKRTKTSSSTGLCREECNAILSAEFLEALNKEKRKLISWK